MTWHALDVDGPIGTTPVAVPLVDEPATRVLLVRTADGTVHATALACPHLGQPLSRGQLDGDVVECAQHHYRYRVTDGACVGPGGPLAGHLVVHEVREDGGHLEVRLAGEGTSAGEGTAG